MNRTALIGFTAIAILVAGLTVGCSTEPKSDSDKAALAASGDAALASFRAKDPTLQGLLNRSVGYAIFPDVGKGGFIIGASHGRGEVFEGWRKIGYAEITQGSIGLQAGGQTFNELVVFMRQSDLDRFKQGKFSVEGNASAVAVKSGAAAAGDLSKGVIVFVETKGGLMAEAAVGGQVIDYKPM